MSALFKNLGNTLRGNKNDRKINSFRQVLNTRITQRIPNFIRTGIDRIKLLTKALLHI